MDPGLALGLTSVAPLVLAFGLPLASKAFRSRALETVYYMASTLLVLALNTVVAYAVFVDGAIVVYPFGGWPPPLGVAYVADRLSTLLGLVTALVTAVSSIYTCWHSRHMENSAMLYTLMLILEAGIMGVLYTSDVFNVYIMLEVAGLSAYPLVAFYSHRRRALVAAARYAILAATITALYFFATVLLYSSAGTLNMGCLAVKARNTSLPGDSVFFTSTLYGPRVFFIVYLALAVWTSYLLSALFPNHFWLPDAHSEAPSPVSAVLSGLYVNMGIYFFARIVYTVYGGGVFSSEVSRVMGVTLALASIATLYGALMMGFEDDVKRILSYSTVMNVGFIYMGISLGTELGVTAGLYHMLNHAVGKTLAFLAIGFLVRRYRSRSIYSLEGTGHAHPLVMFALIAGFLHLIGLPPFGGFFSKVLLFQALVSSGSYAGAVTLLVATVASSYGYLRVLEHLWHMPFPSRIIRRESSPMPVKTVLSILVAAIVILGLLQPTIQDVLSSTSRQLIGGYMDYVSALYSTYKMLAPS